MDRGLMFRNNRSVETALSPGRMARFQLAAYPPRLLPKDARAVCSDVLGVHSDVRLKCRKSIYRNPYLAFFRACPRASAAIIASTMSLEVTLKG
jgi:hypothetical protein